MASLADRWCFIDQSMVKNKPRHTDVGHTVSPGSSEEVLMKKTILTLLAVVAVFCCTAPAAQASSSSHSVQFNSSVRLTGNVWRQTILDWDNCANYATSVVSNRVLDSVTNKTVAEPYGLGASAWGLSVSGPGGSTSTTWTNSNSRGSYLSGNVCASWNTLYLAMTVNGTGNYNGVVRTVAAQV